MNAGFINPANLSLVRIVDLDTDLSSNADETRVDEWGAVTIRTLKEWSFAVSLLRRMGGN